MKTVLRVGNVALRAALLVIVAVITFKAPWPGAGYSAVLIVAVAVATLQLAAWAPADLQLPVRLRYAFLLPYALAAVALTCGMAAGTPTGGELSIQAVLAVLTAGSDTSLAAGLYVTAAGIFGCELTWLVFGASIIATLEHPAILIVAWMVGRNLRARQVQADQSAALLARADQLREEQAKVAALDERARIAREIHDVLAHSLGALGLHIEFARTVLTDRHDEARAVELLGQAHRMAADGLAETRRAVHALRGETLPLPDTLARLGADHQRRHAAPVTFEAAGQPRPLSPDAELAITRTAQEALVNTAKHAPHLPVGIRLDYAGAATALVVTSRLAVNGHDGRGGSGYGAGLATLNGGYGLTGMRERLRLIGGTLTAGRQGGDWVVVAEVPQ